METAHRVRVRGGRKGPLLRLASQLCWPARVALALQVAEVFLRLLDGSEGNANDDDDDGQAIQLSLPFRSLELHGKTAEWWSWCREMFEESCTMSLSPDY